MIKYGIKIVDANGYEYLLCEEGSTEFQTFDNYEDADDFNYEFEDSLTDGLSSEVIEIDA